MLRFLPPKYFLGHCFPNGIRNRTVIEFLKAEHESVGNIHKIPKALYGDNTVNQSIYYSFIVHLMVLSVLCIASYSDRMINE
jgi:hypothetical protein